MSNATSNSRRETETSDVSSQALMLGLEIAPATSVEQKSTLNGMHTNSTKPNMTTTTDNDTAITSLADFDCDEETIKQIIRDRMKNPLEVPPDTESFRSKVARWLVSLGNRLDPWRQDHLRWLQEIEGETLDRVVAGANLVGHELLILREIQIEQRTASDRERMQLIRDLFVRVQFHRGAATDPSLSAKEGLESAERYNRRLAMVILSLPVDD